VFYEEHPRGILMASQGFQQVLSSVFGLSKKAKGLKSSHFRFFFQLFFLTVVTLV
jgi:hypothetical protein